MEIKEEKNECALHCFLQFLLVQIWRRPLLNRIMFKSLRYRLALHGRAARHNKTLKLKCLGVGEPLGYSSPSACAKGDQPHCSFFFMETKL